MKQITAKYDGRCDCGWQWEAGDTIYWEKGQPPICYGCGRSEEDRMFRQLREKQNKGAQR